MDIVPFCTLKTELSEREKQSNSTNVGTKKKTMNEAHITYAQKPTKTRNVSNNFFFVIFGSDENDRLKHIWFPNISRMSNAVFSNSMFRSRMIIVLSLI